jgi:hypothetical protein
MTGTPMDVATHGTFLKAVALVDVPATLPMLLSLLEMQGRKLIQPEDRKGMNPFLIPISEWDHGERLCYVRWPTMAENTEAGLDLQIVVTTPMGGIRLYAMNTDAMCRRMVAEMDFYGQSGCTDAIEMLNKDEVKYTSGDYVPFLRSGKFDVITEDDLRLVMDRYLLTKVGPFPDCYERLATHFKSKDDVVSALVTCERAVSLFYGFGHPVSFHANMLMESERVIEGKDVAKSALGMPLWTTADSKEDLNRVAKSAGYTGIDIIGEMHAYRARDSREEEQGKDLPKEQVALDQAAHLMDAVVIGAVEGGWTMAVPEIAGKYKFSGYPDVAKFLLTYKDF